MRRWRRVGYGFAAAIGVLVVMAASAVLLLHTGLGKTWVADVAGRFLSDKESRTEIGAIGGSIFDGFTIDRVTMADRRGVWLVAERVAIEWAPLKLLDGRIDIRKVEIGRLAIARQPAPSDAKPAADGDFADSLPKLALDRLTIGELELAEPVLGAAARLTLAAAVRFEGPAAGFSAMLDARRIDGAAGTLRAETRYVPQTKTFSISVDAEEAAGGLLSRLGDVEGLPPIKAEIRGNGSLDAWDGRIDMWSGQDQLARVRLGIRPRGAGHVLALEMQAAGERLLPKAYADVLAGGSTARAELRFERGRGIEIERAEIAAAGLRLNLSGRIAPGFDTLAIRFEMQSADARAGSLVATELGWQSLALTGVIDGPLHHPAITAELNVGSLAFRGNRASSLQLKVQARPTPPGRGDQRLAVTAGGHIEGVVSADPRLAKLVADRIELNAAGTVDAAGDVEIASATVTTGPSSARFAGRVARQAVTGRLTLDRVDLAKFAALTGLGVAGEAALTADIDGTADGALALTVRGAVTDIALGMPAVDGLLQRKLEIAGGVRRAKDGAFAFENFTLRGVHMAFTATGSATQASANVAFKLDLPELAKADARLAGRASLAATLTGSLAKPDLAVALDIADATALGRKVERVAIALNVRDFTGDAEGTFTATGAIDGKPLMGRAEIAAETTGDRAIRNFEIAIGSAKLGGLVRIDPRQKLNGRLTLEAGDLRDISALLLTELGGKIDGAITFAAGPDDTQQAEFEITGTALAAGATRIESARWRGAIAGFPRAPSVDSVLEIKALRASGNLVSTARIAAKGGLADLRLQIDASANGAAIAMAALIDAAGAAPSLRLETLRLQKNGRDLRLAAPAVMTVQPEGFVLGRILLRSGSGTIAVEGRIASTIDLRVAFGAFPLDAVALVAAGFDFGGAVSGEIHVTGAAEAPSARYDLKVAQLRTAATQALAAGPFALTARGVATAERVQISAALTGPGQAVATIEGAVPLSGAGALALAIKGRLDLAMANPLLATRGARISGPLTVDVALSGSMRAPRIAGSVQLSRGRFDDAVNGLFLDRIELAATGTNEALTITRLTGVARNGGTVTGEGRITLDPQAGFPGRLALRAQNALLVANDTVSAVADARLELSGALAQRPRIGGRVDLRTLEVTIPDRLPAAAAMIDVRHVNVPAKLRPQLPARPRPVAAGRPAFTAELDLEIAAPVRVYVRGRGVDAELGGTLRLRGTNQQPQLAGGFDLKRGRLDLLGKTLAFTRGRMTFPGTFDPSLDFVATSTADDVVATVTVSGMASDPKFAFGSTPSLPQDEVLARIFFGRPSSRLTTGQAIQLAQAAAQLSGAGGPGVLDRVRRRLGVDTLDVGAGPKGNTPQLGVGRRVSDRVFLGVRQGATPGSSRATVDIDITRNIKIQGEAGADSSTSIGIGAEWNY